MPKKYEWKDTTSYSRGDLVRKPTCWTIEEKNFLRVTVMWSTMFNPGMWSFNCYELSIRDETLPGIPEGDLAKAQKAALHVLAFRLTRLMQSVASFQNGR